MENIARYIDHTNLRADASREEIVKLCNEAKQYGFASVCVNPYYVPLAKELLADCDTAVCTVIGFPLGQDTLADKVAQGKNAVANGADELDMVINISALHDGDDKYVAEEIAAVCALPALVKVIIECCLLSDDEKVRAANLCVQAGADFVKTSTGFSKGGATVADVALLKSTVGDKCKVKAAGGIRDAAAAEAMIKAGADRLGCSAGVQIVNS